MNPHRLPTLRPSAEMLAEYPHVFDERRGRFAVVISDASGFIGDHAHFTTRRAAERWGAAPLSDDLASDGFVAHLVTLDDGAGSEITRRARGSMAWGARPSHAFEDAYLAMCEEEARRR